MLAALAPAGAARSLVQSARWLPAREDDQVRSSAPTERFRAGFTASWPVKLPGFSSMLIREHKASVMGRSSHRRAPCVGTAPAVSLHRGCTCFRSPSTHDGRQTVVSSHRTAIGAWIVDEPRVARWPILTSGQVGIPAWPLGVESVSATRSSGRLQSRSTDLMWSRRSTRPTGGQWVGWMGCASCGSPVVRLKQRRESPGRSH